VRIMANFWLTADTHLNHANIIEYCGRPFKSVEHMNMELVRRWNEVVHPGDTVLHLGDLCFRYSEYIKSPDSDFEFVEKIIQGYEYWASQLNGKIILVKGNHDTRRDVGTALQTCSFVAYGEFWWCQHHPHFTERFNLCGHVHEKWKIRRKGRKVLVNCGVDVWNFRPISMGHIKELIDSS